MQSLEPMGGRPIPLAWHASLAQGRIAEAQEISNWQQGINIIENNLDIAFNKPDPEALKAAIRALPKTNMAYTGLYATVLAEFDSPERILSILRVVKKCHQGFNRSIQSTGARHCSFQSTERLP